MSVLLLGGWVISLQGIASELVLQLPLHQAVYYSGWQFLGDVGKIVYDLTSQSYGPGPTFSLL